MKVKGHLLNTYTPCWRSRRGQRKRRGYSQHSSSSTAWCPCRHSTEQCSWEGGRPAAGHVRHPDSTATLDLAETEGECGNEQDRVVVGRQGKDKDWWQVCLNENKWPATLQRPYKYPFSAQPLWTTNQSNSAMRAKGAFYLGLVWSVPGSHSGRCRWPHPTLWSSLTHRQTPGAGSRESSSCGNSFLWTISPIKHKTQLKHHLKPCDISVAKAGCCAAVEGFWSTT